LAAAASLTLLAGCGRVSESGSPPAVEAKQAPASNRVTLPAGSPRLSGIRVAPVQSGEIPCDEISAPGKVEVNPNRVARVLMPTSGRIRQVLVRLGDSVAEGQALVLIDSPESGEAITAYRQAMSQVRQGRAALEKAKSDLARLQDLYEHFAAALKDVQNARNEQAQAEAALEQAQAARDAATHRLEILGLNPEKGAQPLTVRSPISGKVLEIAVTAGEYRSDTAASLMTVADLSSVWVAADVPESSIRLIDVGEFVEVELAAYPGEVLRGRVMRIADTVDPATRCIKVQTQLDNRSGRMRPEMFGRIRHTHGTCRVPVAPAGAVVHVEAGTVVFVERGAGDFEAVPVRTGEVRSRLVPLLSGVSEKDRIVVEGAVLLKAQLGGRP
jgi:cobalt-zinc-cadmium efflux system membrane fusion protein